MNTESAVSSTTPPSAQDAVRRLIILLLLTSHATRLMLMWDFSFRTREAFARLTGVTPEWHSLGMRGMWMKLRARWNWFWERHATVQRLASAGLIDHLTAEERALLEAGLCDKAREQACQVSWQVEAAACIAWALGLMPRIWPMDEHFDGRIDNEMLLTSVQTLLRTARLKPFKEISTACERVKMWHWRARQLALERQGLDWPPKDAPPEVIAELQAQGLDTLQGLVRTTTRLFHERGVLDEAINDDFAAKGKAYCDLSDEEAEELMSIAMERHRALNWLCGLAPNNDWAMVPLET